MASPAADRRPAQRFVHDGTNWVPDGEPVEVPTVSIPVRATVLRDGELVTVDGHQVWPAAVVAEVLASSRGQIRERGEFVDPEQPTREGHAPEASTPTVPG